MNIVKLEPPGHQNIPQALRAIADDLEKGEYGPPSAIAIVLENVEGEIHTFGLGRADFYRALALFELGKVALLG